MLTSRKTEKAQALAQLGEALSFQFLCSMPGGFLHFNPWTELIEVRSSSCTESPPPPFHLPSPPLLPRPRPLTPVSAHPCMR